jgi:hypothetical protein
MGLVLGVCYMELQGENVGAHVTAWNSGEGVTAGGDATEHDSTIR